MPRVGTVPALTLSAMISNAKKTTESATEELTFNPHGAVHIGQIKTSLGESTPLGLNMFGLCLIDAAYAVYDLIGPDDCNKWQADVFAALQEGRGYGESFGIQWTFNPKRSLF